MRRDPKTPPDAFGRALLDAFHGDEVGAVIERDDGYIEPEWGKKVYFSAYEEWPRAERAVMRRVKGRVLDVGCGAGRHSLFLQKRGLDVTGIDPSPGALRVCRLRGLRGARRLALSQVGGFPRGSFDTVIMMGNNFGLVESPSKARAHLERLHRATSPDARIIAQTLDPRQTRLPEHKAYQRRNRSRRRATGQIRLRLRYRRLLGPWFDYLFVSVRELRAILRGTGWTLERTIPIRGPLYFMVLSKAGRRPS
ncbi:MAG: class I SAM-dependent methyltransferase [Elusimicrobia bacterium]|nr:class I SAM-dependent methyltransferase [Elusimicrobiota bacterium]